MCDIASGNLPKNFSFKSSADAEEFPPFGTFGTSPSYDIPPFKKANDFSTTERFTNQYTAEK